MDDIFGNALGLDQSAHVGRDWPRRSADFPLTALLEQEVNAPMLVVNGADDVHVPQQDTLLFTGRRDTEVRLVPGTGHVAASKLPEVVPVIAEWLAKHL